VGLFSRRPKDGVHGTAQVVAASHYRGDGVYQNCAIQLVVTVEGIAPYSAEVHQLVPGKKWPQPGMTLPVTVSRSDPQQIKIDFDGVPTGAERARLMAEQQAAIMRGESPPTGFGMGAPGVQFVGGSPADLPPEKLAALEQMLGMDLDGDGAVGAAQTQSAAPVDDSADDRLGRLERLAQLRASGALTDAEFAAEKQRILDS
jgi:hypothetical protein